MHFHFGHFAGLFEHIAQGATHRMRERDMSDDAFAKESRFARPRAGAVEKLFGNNHVERRILLLQRTDRGRGQDALDAKQFHRIDVSAKWNFGWRKAVTAA